MKFYEIRKCCNIWKTQKRLENIAKSQKPSAGERNIPTWFTGDTYVS
jgi:hypothetical protein